MICNDVPITGTGDGDERLTRSDSRGSLSGGASNGMGSRKGSFSSLFKMFGGDKAGKKNNVDSDDDVSVEEKPENSCSYLYGPYPGAIPVPYLSKTLDTPPVELVKNARTMWDLKDHPDYRDVGTPDEWVPRDGRLVRLTGRHPFNVEPPLHKLNEHKFITPSSLHYVRNHGAVPKLTWQDHTVCVGGPLVKNPLTLHMSDLVDMPARELPVTLVCAGNRRKEQNMIRQTIGFNWGPSGVSTNVYKGVLVRDLLKMAGVSEKNMDGKHVEFIGMEDLPNKVGPGPFKTEPWGKLVKYGTSVPLGRAMNPAFDVLIAYQANGEVLQPDHGYPVRLVIPGYIGGRMIKWLKHINVIDNETKNHYHYHDNRILPPHITAEESLSGKWWYKPEYIFNELNINSAISKPDHDETLVIAQNIEKQYTVNGYAYTGGGRKICRVEVSYDKGTHWHLAEVERKEKPNTYGMYWCWVWWQFHIPVSDLISTKEIWCRAWDESNNAQPDNPTWNLMGMGNNQCFRVKVHLDRNKQNQAVFRFEHPTQPGQQTGGWMTKQAGKPISAGYGNLLEIQGQEEAGLPAAVKPALQSVKAAAKKKKKAPVVDEEIIDSKGNFLALNPKKKIPFKLQKKIVLSHDSFLLDFALQTPEHILGLPTGKHIFLSNNVDGKLVMRRYTPVSSNFDVGCVQFVIKAYPPSPPRFPKGGIFSQHLDSLKIGETVFMRGPVGEFEYVKNGEFELDGEECHAKTFNMIAGGTGITPVMQIAAEILRHPEDQTKVSLIFACREENDLLMRSTIDEWAKAFPNKFTVEYILSDKWPTGWKYSTGFVSKDLFQKKLHPPGPDCYNLMCGPPIMLEKGCTPNFLALGHDKNKLFSF